MTHTTSPGLMIPLSPAAHYLAQQFAGEQATPAKGKQVYLNTLAIWAVHRYLKWLHIPTDLAVGNSWNAGLRSILDVTDLVLPDLGTLECRPVLPGEEAIALPSVTDPGCIGYVGVRFGDMLDQVELLGFVPIAAVHEDLLPLSELCSMDVLMECLNDLEHQAIVPAQTVAPILAATVHLHHWLQNQFEAGWQAIEAVMGAEAGQSGLNLAFRYGQVRRAKVMTLSNQECPVIVALVVTLVATSADQSTIHLQLCPVQHQGVLPPQIQLHVLTETGEVFQAIEAGEADTFLQFELTAHPGESFSVDVIWRETCVREQFVA